VVTSTFQKVSSKRSTSSQKLMSNINVRNGQVSCEYYKLVQNVLIGIARCREAHARRYNQKTAPSIRTDTLQNEGARTRDSWMRKALLFASDPSPFSFLVLRFHHSLVLTVRFSFTTHAPHSHTGLVNYWKTYIYSPRARTLMYRDREMR
jgi:hypothetical protein